MHPLEILRLPSIYHPHPRNERDKLESDVPTFETVRFMVPSASLGEVLPELSGQTPVLNIRHPSLV